MTVPAGPTGEELFGEAVRDQPPGRSWAECAPWVRHMWADLAARRVPLRRFVRFRDEWTDHPSSAPSWYTACFLGTVTRTVAGRTWTEGRWRVDGLERWEYGEDELILGDLTDGALARPVPGSWDRADVRPKRGASS